MIYCHCLKHITHCILNNLYLTFQSKGGILAKACEYILELRRAEEQLSDCVKEIERLNSHIDFLQQQNEKLKVHNALLRSELSQRGIIIPCEAVESRSTSVASDS